MAIIKKDKVKMFSIQLIGMCRKTFQPIVFLRHSSFNFLKAIFNLYLKKQSKFCYITCNK